MTIQSSKNVKKQRTWEISSISTYYMAGTMMTGLVVSGDQGNRTVHITAR